MKTQPLFSWSRPSAAACFILALVSCCSSENTRKAAAASQAGHPMLSLHAGKVSRSLLISDAELQNGSCKRGKPEHVSVFNGTVMIAMSMPLMEDGAGHQVYLMFLLADIPA